MSKHNPDGTTEHYLSAPETVTLEGSHIRTITMSLTKTHKTLAEYAQLDGDLQPVKKPALSPIYIRKSEFEVNGELPTHFDIAINPVYAEK